jgi:hypothetical protein
MPWTVDGGDNGLSFCLTSCWLVDLTVPPKPKSKSRYEILLKKLHSFTALRSIQQETVSNRHQWRLNPVWLLEQEKNDSIWLLLETLRIINFAVLVVDVWTVRWNFEWSRLTNSWTSFRDRRDHVSLSSSRRMLKGHTLLRGYLLADIAALPPNLLLTLKLLSI